jgi:thiosulfate reductase cytochrome b subunit
VSPSSAAQGSRQVGLMYSIRCVHFLAIYINYLFLFSTTVVCFAASDLVVLSMVSGLATFVD